MFFCGSIARNAAVTRGMALKTANLPDLSAAANLFADFKPRVPLKRNVKLIICTVA